MKPVNSTEYKRRSSRSGSLVNTPDHQTKHSIVPVGHLFALDNVGETSGYLEANDSSATNSTCSFDAPPDQVPPVPPRITNPPRNPRLTTSDHLIIIDTDDTTDMPPVPVARTKTKFYTSMSAPTPPPPPNRHPNFNIGFENNFVLNANSLNIQKNNGVGRAPPFIEPPPLNHKLNMTNESKTSEVRISSFHFSFNCTFQIWPTLVSFRSYYYSIYYYYYYFFLLAVEYM